MADKEQKEGQEVERMLRDYQVVQEQLRSSAMQLDQLQNAKADLERAKEEIDKSNGKVYISVGGVIIETTREKATTDLKDRTELTTARINSVNKQYNDLRNKEKQLKERISQMYNPGK